MKYLVLYEEHKIQVAAPPGPAECGVLNLYIYLALCSNGWEDCLNILVKNTELVGPDGTVNV